MSWHINPYSLSLLTFWIHDHIAWNFLLFELQNLSFINIYMPAECGCNRSYPRRGAIRIQSSFGIFSQVTLSTRQINTLPTLHQWFEVLWLLRVPVVSCVFVPCDMFHLFSIIWRNFFWTLSGRHARNVKNMEERKGKWIKCVSIIFCYVVNHYEI